MTTLRDVINNPAHQDMPLQSIRDDLNVLLDEAEMNGSLQSVTQERIDSFTETATGTPLNWAKGFGDDLLDFSDPAAPFVIDAGTYALSLFVMFSTFTSGSWMHIDVEMDSVNDDWDMHDTAPLVAGMTNNGVGVSITAKLPAEAKLVCTLYSNAVLPGGAGAAMRGQIAKIK